MANIIVRVYKPGKQDMKRSDMTNNLLTVTISIPKCHNKTK